MFDETKELHDLSELYRRYVSTLAEYHSLKLDRNRVWCEENEEIETARQEAESAMRNYMNMISDVYYHRENELSKKLHKHD